MHRIIYEQAALPVMQNRLHESREEALLCLQGNMVLAEDRITGLIRNLAFDAGRLHYDSNYQNEQSLSNVFRRHLDYAADLVMCNTGGAPVVELGCGKGTFLSILRNRGAEATGMDPAFDGEESHVRKEFFTGQPLGHKSFLVLRHVLEHMADPVDFLSRVAQANGNGGLVYIEVPCFDWICRNLAWFDIHYEHANYFRPSDFSRMFKSCLHLSHGHGGQYIMVVADLSSLRVPRRDHADRVQVPAELEPDFSSTSASSRVIWGGSSKGVVYSVLRERAGRPVDMVLDINPAKQGKFLPVSGVQVQDPAQALAGLSEETEILVMNPHHLEEVRKLVSPRFIVKGALND
jgi:hypothetical protein